MSKHLPLPTINVPEKKKRQYRRLVMSQENCEYYNNSYSNNSNINNK